MQPWQSLETVHVGHRQVEQDHVRAVLFRLIERFSTIGRFGDDFEVVFKPERES